MNRPSSPAGETPLYSRNLPLELISPKNDDSMNSTFGAKKEVDAQTGTFKDSP